MKLYRQIAIVSCGFAGSFILPNTAAFSQNAPVENNPVSETTYVVTPGVAAPSLVEESAAGLMVREIEYRSPDLPVGGNPCETINRGTDKAAAPCEEPVSDGREAVKNFRMQVPADWEVKFNTFGYAVLLEPMQKIIPSSGETIIDPTIKVSATRRPIPIDQTSLEEYAAVIEKSFRKANGEGVNFQIYGKKLVSDLPGQREGLLYFAKFETNGLVLQQAILIQSSDQALFRTELTEVEKNFEASYQKYYPILTSLSFQGGDFPRPNVLGVFGPWILTLGIVFSVLGIVGYIRRRRIGRLIAEAEAEYEGTEDIAAVQKKSPMGRDPDDSMDMADSTKESTHQRDTVDSPKKSKDQDISKDSYRDHSNEAKMGQDDTIEPKKKGGFWNRKKENRFDDDLD